MALWCDESSGGCSSPESSDRSSASAGEGGVEQQGHGAQASLLYSEEGRGTGSGTPWKGSGGGTDGRDENGRLLMSW
jgi:hypothetical protein